MSQLLKTIWQRWTLKLIVTALIVSIAGGLFVISPVRAATLEQLGAKKTELQKQIEQKQKEAADKKAAADAEKKRQAELNSAIKKLASDITVTSTRISDTERSISDTAQSITGVEADIAKKEEQMLSKKGDLYETVAEYSIELDQGNELYAILGADRISGALDRLNSLNNLSDKLVIDGENLDHQRGELVAKKADLQNKKQDLLTQKNQLSIYQEALDVQKDQKAVLASESKEAQQKYLTEANQASKVSEDLKKQFATVANEEAAMRRAASTRAISNIQRGTNPSSYGLIWPIGGRITTYFGGSTPFQNYHTGLDIAGPAGDPIVAAGSGTVTLATKMCCSEFASTVDKSYGYGNYVMIKLDNGLVVLTAHMLQITVNPGQHVERGQGIGYRGGSAGMAGSGWSTGAHTHFEVRDAQGPDDPLRYLP